MCHLLPLLILLFCSIVFNDISSSNQVLQLKNLETSWTHPTFTFDPLKILSSYNLLTYQSCLKYNVSIWIITTVVSTGLSGSAKDDKKKKKITTSTYKHNFFGLLQYQFLALLFPNEIIVQKLTLVYFIYF